MTPFAKLVAPHFHMRSVGWLAATLGAMATATVASAQLGDSVFIRLNHPAIEYGTRPTMDPVSKLNRKIQEDEVRLKFQDGDGYLRSVLEALDIPIESQLAVFSKTSAQAPLIDPKHPRTIFFNDSVAVAWTRGGFLELASHDPHQGVIFYDLPQEPASKPVFSREDWCLGCHHSFATLGVPGLMVRSIPTAADGTPMPWLGNYTSDHRSPLGQRWGGWYVTGETGSVQHLGNLFASASDSKSIIEKPSHLESLKAAITDGYISSYSDIVALLVFEHQLRMTNLLTRIGWEVRTALADRRADLQQTLDSMTSEVVDYMLFVDEAPLTSRIVGTSGFAEKFAAEGPRDARGRSLRQLDLEHRLMRYPCSYMIYTAAFDALPVEAGDAIYERMWDILSGQEQAAKYQRLSLADRQAIVEILRDTKKGLPEYFRPVMH